MGTAQLAISLIGPFQVTLEGRPVTAFESNKVRALLVYLAAEPGRAHPRETLAGLLWPDFPQPSALAYLRHALADLRRVTGDRQAKPPYLTITRTAIQLNPDAPIQVDVSQFEELIARGSEISALQAAVALPRGPFLDGFSCDSAAFEEWAMARRERLARQQREALGRLAALHAGAGEHEESVRRARQLLELEPWDEAAHRMVMAGLAESGQRSAALGQYESCRRVLKEGLNVEPGAETQVLYERIRSGELSPAAGAIPFPVRAEAAARPNLPTPLTSLVGREGELAEVRCQLGFPPPGAAAPRVKVRLLTLSGAGGCGKTRLAIEAARSLEKTGGFRDGACWVDLTALSDPGLVPVSVATALGLPEPDGASVGGRLKKYLSSKTLLLVLDNTEHLIEACAFLAQDLLNECPELVILVTSREPLGVPGEVVWRVPSLAVPEQRREEQVSPAELLHYSAINLFVQRAEAALPGWTLSGSEAAVVRICRRLDGIPLAIELAAARVRMMAVEQIAARLQDTFSLLSGGSRTALPRHQTLQSCIEWSYTLLSAPERSLLQSLAVFAGGWTLEAAEAVGAAQAGPAEILDLLAQLVDKSLVIVEQKADKRVRYRLLETIRQYAQGKLTGACGEAAARDRHLDYFLYLARTAEPNLHTQDQAALLDRLEEELDNIRAGLEWSLATRIEAGLELGAALMYFWMIRGHNREGIVWLERQLEAEKRGRSGLRLNPARTLLRGRALYSLGILLEWQNQPERGKAAAEESQSLLINLGEVGRRDLAVCRLHLGRVLSSAYEADHARKLSLLKESLAFFRETKELFYTARCLYQIGIAFSYHSEFAEARKAYTKALALFNEIGDQDGMGGVFRMLGQLAVYQGDYHQARDMYEKSLACYYAINSLTWVIRVMYDLAVLSYIQNDFSQATRLCEEVITMSRDLGDPWEGLAYAHLGRIACWSGDYDQAQRCCEEALAVSQAKGSRFLNFEMRFVQGYLAFLQGNYALAFALSKELLALSVTDQGSGYIHEILGYMAILTAARKQLTHSARLFGALESLCPWGIYLIPPAEQVERARALAAVREGLGTEAFARGWDEGQAMNMEQAIAYLRAFAGGDKADYVEELF